jgi:hypothetical protein
MLKKVILGIVAAVLLLGAENLFAQEREANERAEKRTLRRAERAGREAGHKRMEGVQQKRQGFRPVQERFDKWFRKLTKAYEDNDREKMGQLLRKMHQFREGQTKAKDAVGKRRQDFRGRDEAGKGRHGRFHSGPGKHGQGFQHTGMGRPDPDMPPRGMGRRQQRTHGGGRGYRNPGFPHRGMRNRRQDRHSSEWDW